MSLFSARLRRWYDVHGALRAQALRQARSGGGFAGASAAPQPGGTPMRQPRRRAPGRRTRRPAGGARARLRDVAGRTGTHSAPLGARVANAPHGGAEADCGAQAGASRAWSRQRQPQAARGRCGAQRRRPARARGATAKRRRVARRTPGAGAHTQGPCTAPCRSRSATGRCSPAVRRAAVRLRAGGALRGAFRRTWRRLVPAARCPPGGVRDILARPTATRGGACGSVRCAPFFFAAFAGPPNHRPTRPTSSSPAIVRVVSARSAIHCTRRASRSRAAFAVQAGRMAAFGHGPPDAYGCPLPPLGIEASAARQVRLRCAPAAAWDRARHGHNPATHARDAATALRGARGQARRQAGVAGTCARQRGRSASRAAPRRAWRHVADAYDDARPRRTASATKRLRRFRWRATT
jgi:hypothetical protein